MDWRIGTGGNAGIFYRGTEEYEHIVLERAGVPAAG